MNIWEKRDIPRPPDYTIEYTQKDLIERNLGQCAQSLIESINDGLEALNHTAVTLCTRKEVSILTALLYRSSRHRSEKFYRVLRKVEKCCTRWLQLHLPKEIDRLHNLMPRVALHQRTLRMPSKQMFEYLVARLLGTYHLMVHLDGICREAANLLLSKLSTAHFLATVSVLLANVSRIRVLALDYGGVVAKIYNDILPQLGHLKGSEAPPLLDTDCLPSSISSRRQKHRSSHDVNSNSVNGNKPSANSDILSLLHIGKEENDASDINDNKLADEDSPTSKTREASEGVEIRVSSSYMEEDIGECVQRTITSKKNEKSRKRSFEDIIESGSDNETSIKKVKKSKTAVDVTGTHDSKKKKKKKGTKESMNIDGTDNTDPTRNLDSGSANATGTKKIKKSKAPVDILSTFSLKNKAKKKSMKINGTDSTDPTDNMESGSDNVGGSKEIKKNKATVNFNSTPGLKKKKDKKTSMEINGMETTDPTDDMESGSANVGGGKKIKKSRAAVDVSRSPNLKKKKKGKKKSMKINGTDNTDPTDDMDSGSASVAGSKEIKKSKAAVDVSTSPGLKKKKKGKKKSLRINGTDNTDPTDNMQSGSASITGTKEIKKSKAAVDVSSASSLKKKGKKKSIKIVGIKNTDPTNNMQSGSTSVTGSKKIKKSKAAVVSRAPSLKRRRPRRKV